MIELGVKSILRRKFVVTTVYPIAKNLLGRNLECNSIGEKWVSDITCIRVNNDRNYLTTIMDLADRKLLVGHYVKI